VERRELRVRERAKNHAAIVKNVDLISFPDEQDLAEAAAEQWLKQLETQSRRERSPYCVALAGGRITRRFFETVAQLAAAGSDRWRAVQFFWSDERCVSPDDPESNFGMARDLLLAPLRIPEDQIHRVRGEEPSALAASRAEAELRRIATVGPAGQPLLDLIFLGMGEDGHVASLFPGESEETMASKAVYRDVKAVKPPPHRITMGYATIAAARQTWVLASGSGKETALRESLRPGSHTPLARVLRLRSQTRILTTILK
jgi:6-phosphogluconolactonase